MDLDVYVLGKDGSAGRRRGLLVHVAPAGARVGRAMVPPVFLCIRVTGAPEDWAKTLVVGAHEEGDLRLKGRWVFNRAHGSQIAWKDLILVDRLPAARAIRALGGKVDG